MDDNRRALLPLLGQLTEGGYYLAGDTGLALQIGHRDSIDFDFFTLSPIDTEKLFMQCEELFLSKGHTVLKIQEEKNTLGIVVDGNIKVSFMTYPYNLIADSATTEYFTIASQIDIACMKLSAITSRSLEKDYIDLYYLLQQYPISDLLDHARQKFPTIDSAVILKSLVYFDDITPEPILFKSGFEVDMNTLQEYIKNKVLEYSRSEINP